MPIYEYICEECHSPFERLLLSKTEPVACPACGSDRYTLQFSLVAAPRKAENGEAAGPSCACTPTTCGCN